MGLDIAKHKLFDAFGPLDDAVTNPTAFGLSDVTNACAQFTACDPSQYLFWDGIHPTSAADLIISDAIESLITAVPEPSAVALLGSPLLGWALLTAVLVMAATRSRSNNPKGQRIS